MVRTRSTRHVLALSYAHDPRYPGPNQTRGKAQSSRCDTAQVSERKRKRYVRRGWPVCLPRTPASAPHGRALEATRRRKSRRGVSDQEREDAARRKGAYRVISWSIIGNVKALYCRMLFWLSILGHCSPPSHPHVWPDRTPCRTVGVLDSKVPITLPEPK